MYTDTTIILDRITAPRFTREDIKKQAQIINPHFKQTQMRYLMGTMLESGDIVRVSRGIYQRATSHTEKKEYENCYTDSTKKIIRRLEKKYPLLEYRVWELCWLNEFFNHQIAHNKTFVEVEHEGCAFVYDYLFDMYQGKILLHPTSEEIVRYGIDGTIIVDRLISESPAGKPERYNVPLEKIIVDLFANKIIQTMVSQGDYPEAVTNMFRAYKINMPAIHRYARRRNKDKEVVEFLRNNIEIEC